MAGTTMAARNERQHQSPFEECSATLGERHNESVHAIERLVHAGEQVSFTVHGLIRMMKDGISLEGFLHRDQDDRYVPSHLIPGWGK